MQKGCKNKPDLQPNRIDSPRCKIVKALIVTALRSKHKNSTAVLLQVVKRTVQLHCPSLQVFKYYLLYQIVLKKHISSNITVLHYLLPKTVVLFSEVPAACFPVLSFPKVVLLSCLKKNRFVQMKKNSILSTFHSIKSASVTWCVCVCVYEYNCFPTPLDCLCHFYYGLLSFGIQ